VAGNTKGKPNASKPMIEMNAPKPKMEIKGNFKQDYVAKNNPFASFGASKGF
jgi:hypothetical protein